MILTIFIPKLSESGLLPAVWSRIIKESPEEERRNYTDSQKLCRNGIALMQILRESVRVTGTCPRDSGRHRRRCRCETESTGTEVGRRYRLPYQVNRTHGGFAGNPSQPCAIDPERRCRTGMAICGAACRTQFGNAPRKGRSKEAFSKVRIGEEIVPHISFPVSSWESRKPRDQ